MRDALARRDAGEYLRLMNASGRSSEQLLRNIQVPGGDRSACAGACLCVGAARRGGCVARTRRAGFAGGVQALMPCTAFPAYRQAMEARFGPGSLP